MDRFFYSTAAYAIATATTTMEELPPIGSGLYLWPADLPKPTAVVLLQTDSEMRSRRVVARSHAEQVSQLDVFDSYNLPPHSVSPCACVWFHRLR
jgi:thymidylate kinase